MKAAIKVGSWVRTADGTEGRVTYISPKGEAQIFPKSGSDYLSLPLTELRKATETRRPPIQGMPTDRPRCPYCDRPLKPNVDEDRTFGSNSRILSRTFRSWDGYGIVRGNDFDKFCTLRCARSFANAAWVAGYRVKKGGK